MFSYYVSSIDDDLLRNLGADRKILTAEARASSQSDSRT